MMPVDQLDILSPQVNRISNGAWVRLECVCCKKQLHGGVGQDIHSRDMLNFVTIHGSCGWTEAKA